MTDAEGLRDIVQRAATMGSCSQTHHEHLANDARAALRSSESDSGLDEVRRAITASGDDVICHHATLEEHDAAVAREYARLSTPRTEPPDR